MISKGRKALVKLTYMTIDVVLLCLIFYGVSLIRQSTLPYAVSFKTIFLDPSNPYRFVYYFWIVVTIILNNSHGLYETQREIFEVTEIWQVIKTAILSSLFAIVLIYVARIEAFPRSILFLAAFFMSVLFSAWRFAKRQFVRYLVSQGYNNFNALIIGAGKVGNMLAGEIKRKPDLGINIVGFLDDFKTEQLENGNPKIIGKISEFKEIAPKEFINKIFITIHQENELFRKLLGEAKDLGIAVRVVPQGFDLMSGEYHKYNIGLIPVIEYSDVLNLRSVVSKRLFDMIATWIILIPLVPVFLAIAFMIKIDNPGPIFYKSRRYGRRGRIFNMLKFRSMIQDADAVLADIKDKNEVDGPIFKIKEDPRITNIGRCLRRYSLDELPQLLNVIQGHMSLVGPRPLPIDQIEKEDLRQIKRLEIRPGITGLWQIRGRSDVSFARLIRWDVWYIKNWSFWLDVNILLQTIPVVIKGKGAY